MARDERLLPLPTNADLPLQMARPENPATYAPIYDGEPFAEKRPIREYVNVVLKRKWVILAIVTIVTLSTAIFMYRQPSIYQAQTQVLIEARQNKQADKTVTLNLWFDTKYWDTQVKLIQNPNLMSDAVVALGLHKSPVLPGEQTGPGLFGAVGNLVTGTKPSADKSANLPVLTTDSASISSANNVQLSPEEAKRAEEYGEILVRSLTVEPVDKTNLINLKFQSTNRDLATNIPNALAKVFIAKDIKREMQGSLDAIEDNTKSIAELQQNINILQRQKTDYQTKSRLPLLQGKTQDIMAQRLQSLDALRITANNEANTLFTRYQAALGAQRAGTPYSIPEVSESLIIQKARE